MRANWRMVVLVALFFLQTLFVFAQDRLFYQAMEIKRERVRRDSIEAGGSEKQAQVISSVMEEVRYEVSSYVRNVVVLSLIFNFSMFIVALSIRQTDVT